jgi:hypothetical protein
MAGSSCVRSSRSIALSLSALLALLAGACGSSQLAPTTTTTVAAPAADRISDAWPLSDHVVSPAAFPGSVRLHRPSAISTAPGWARFERASSQAREVARLRALGFEGGVNEQLYGRFPMSAEMVSTTEQYRTAAGARAELSYQFGQLERAGGAQAGVLSMSGIPGARGVRVASDGTVGLNVLFSVGPYFYVVGVGYPEGARGAPPVGQLLAGARLLYLAVNGCVAPPANRASRRTTSPASASTEQANRSEVS